MTTDSVPTTIMIIDDRPDNLEVLGEMLQAATLDVRAFPGGELALAAARQEPPDLVMLDIRMPGMDGYEVCRRFKADEQLRQIPIIFLSAFTEPTEKARAFAAGGVDYVTKPFSEVEVLARIQTHLRLRRHQLQLEELVNQRVGELAAAHRQLRIWDDAKSQWLSVLSHEMRTPLNGVFGIAEMWFMDLPADSDCLDLRQDFDTSRARIEKLMDDAVTLAHINVASDSFTLKPVSLRRQLQGALERIAAQCPAAQLRVSLEEVGPVMVLADPQLLTRALSDLLFTAAQCVAAGQVVTLATRVVGGQVHLTLVTRGKALSAAALETFFEVGGQRELLTGGGDFGLGASLASRIIQLFHGSVSLRNDPALGLVMAITLPTASPCR